MKPDGSEFDRLLGLNFLHDRYLITSVLVLAGFGSAATLGMRHGSDPVASKS